MCPRNTRGHVILSFFKFSFLGIFILFLNLFICLFWLRSVFTAAHSIPLVVMIGGNPLVAMFGLLIAVASLVAGPRLQ